VEVAIPAGSMPLPPDSDSSHGLTVESRETKHLAGASNGRASGCQAHGLTDALHIDALRGSSGNRG
jgi:hypothetical protein